MRNQAFPANESRPVLTHPLSPLPEPSASSCMIPVSLNLESRKIPLHSRFFHYDKTRGGRHLSLNDENDDQTYSDDSDSSSCSSTTRGRRRFRKKKSCRGAGTKRSNNNFHQRRPRHAVVERPLNLATTRLLYGRGSLLHQSDRCANYVNGTAENSLDDFPSTCRFRKQSQNDDEESISSLSSFATTYEPSSDED